MCPLSILCDADSPQQCIEIDLYACSLGPAHPRRPPRLEPPLSGALLRIRSSTADEGQLGVPPSLTQDRLVLIPCHPHCIPGPLSRRVQPRSDGRAIISNPLLHPSAHGVDGDPSSPRADGLPTGDAGLRRPDGAGGRHEVQDVRSIPISSFFVLPSAALVERRTRGKRARWLDSQAESGP